MSASELNPDPDEKPRLVLNGGWPRDLLSWVMAVPPLIYLGAIAAGFAGFSAFVILLLLTESVELSIAVGALLAIMVWVWWAREHFGVTGERVRFFRGCVVADLYPNPQRRGPFERHVIPYDRIGTMALGRRKPCIRFHFDLPNPERRSAFTITLPRLNVRDQFDEIVEWIETSAPDHLFVADAEDEPTYSRRWALEDLFPDQREVAGDVTLDRFSSPARLRIADQEFELQSDGFGIVRALAAPGGERPTVAATCISTNAAPTTRVFAGHGLQIATCRMVARDNGLEIITGFGPVLGCRLDSGDLLWDDEKIGTARRCGDGATLALTTPIPVPVVLVLFLVLSFMPHLVPTPRGIPLATE